MMYRDTPESRYTLVGAKTSFLSHVPDMGGEVCLVSFVQIGIKLLLPSSVL